MDLRNGGHEMFVRGDLMTSSIDRLHLIMILVMTHSVGCSNSTVNALCVTHYKSYNKAQH